MHEAHEFLETLAVVFCTAAVTTVLFQRLHQPVVAAERRRAGSGADVALASSRWPGALRGVSCWAVYKASWYSSPA